MSTAGDPRFEVAEVAAGNGADRVEVVVEAGGFELCGGVEGFGGWPFGVPDADAGVTEFGCRLPEPYLDVVGGEERCGSAPPFRRVVLGPSGG